MLCSLWQVPVQTRSTFGTRTASPCGRIERHVMGPKRLSRHAVSLTSTTWIGLALAMLAGPCPVASADVSGSLDDWAAAVCLNGRALKTERPHTIKGYQCYSPGQGRYINFDQFEDEDTMDMVLGVSGNISSAKTTLGGYPFVIWSIEGGEVLAPLKKFGFSVTASVRRSAQPVAPPTGGGSDVPGSARGVVAGQACTSSRTYVFGFSKDGSPLICLTDGVSGNANWVRSQPIAGVKAVGTSCNPNFTAQSPEGRPLICGDHGWTTAR